MTAVRERSLLERVERDVPLERDTADDVLAEAERPGDDPVRAVGADHDVGANRRPVDEGPERRSPSPSRRSTRAPSRTSAPSRAACCGEERVESPSLRHPDQRLVVAPRERRPVAEPQLEAVDVPLDDRRRIDRDPA